MAKRVLWDINDLAATGDLAEELGVSKSVISNWIARHNSFPKPIIELSSGKIFSRQQVRQWYAEWVF